MPDLTIQQQHVAALTRLEERRDNIITTRYNPYFETRRALDWLEELITQDGKLTNARVTELREDIYYIVILYHTAATLEGETLNFIYDWIVPDI